VALAMVDESRARLGGWTRSADFPTTAGAHDQTLDGNFDGFLLELDMAAGTLAHSTYIGGSNDDKVAGLAIDGAGNSLVTGQTISADFPATPGAYDTTFGGGDCIISDCADVFVAKVTSDGSSLSYATYLGGEKWDDGYSIAVDSSGTAYVTGEVQSPEFPTTPDAYDSVLDGLSDAFVARLDESGSTLLYGSFLGGAENESGTHVSFDALGNIVLTGWTRSADFPTTPDAYDPATNGDREMFATILEFVVPPPSTPTSTPVIPGSTPTATSPAPPTSTPPLPDAVPINLPIILR
jgi:hypothetical protein